MKRPVHKTTHKTILAYCIALVWVVNGLVCKVLNLVPRHELIVARILGSDHARAITIIIGILEIMMAAWILSGVKKQLNAIAQIAVIIVMNILEFILAPDLLLWGKLNLFFALLFALVIYLNAFNRNKKQFLSIKKLALLKNHPFAVEAFFKSSLVITFAFPKTQLQALVPGCLELDTFNDQWAFVAVAMVQTRDLRPKGFPKFTGNDFFLIGYRVFVRYTTSEGKKLRGLYILKSETDKKKMELLGNTFTHYNYTTTNIELVEQGGLQEIRSNKSNFALRVDVGAGEIPLPQGSPFSNWKEARRFAGPLPFTFTVDNTSKEVLIIEGVRENWVPRPVEVLNYHFSFLSDLNCGSPLLANAFVVENIPYYWKKGKKDIWKK